MLDRGDAAGVPHLRKAMEIDSDFTEMSAHRLGQYFREVGDLEGQAAIASELETLYAGHAQAARARNLLRPAEYL
jgi:hypothetical protein